MTLKEFVDRWEGAGCDYDGAYGCQCVDTFRQYCKDVWNIPHTGSVGGARELWTNWESLPLEQKYLLRGTGIPEPGDAYVWDQNLSNKWGHVALVLYATKNSLIVFQQLGNTQNDKGHIGVRTYLNGLGWLRKK